MKIHNVLFRENIESDHENDDPLDVPSSFEDRITFLEDTLSRLKEQISSLSNGPRRQMWEDRVTLLNRRVRSLERHLYNLLEGAFSEGGFTLKDGTHVPATVTVNNRTLVSPYFLKMQDWKNHFAGSFDEFRQFSKARGWNTLHEPLEVIKVVERINGVLVHLGQEKLDHVFLAGEKRGSMYAFIIKGKNPYPLVARMYGEPKEWSFKVYRDGTSDAIGTIEDVQSMSFDQLKAKFSEER